MQKSIDLKNKEYAKELESLLVLLPPALMKEVLNFPFYENITEIVLDLGRRPMLRYFSEVPSRPSSPVSLSLCLSLTSKISQPRSGPSLSLVAYYTTILPMMILCV